MEHTDTVLEPPAARVGEAEVDVRGDVVGGDVEGPTPPREATPRPSTRPTPGLPGPSPEVLAARDLLRTGAVAGALGDLERLRPSARRREPLDRALLLGTLVECRLARGDVAEALAVGDALSPLLEAGGHAAAVAHHAKGELALAVADPELALAHFLTVGRMEPPVDPDLAPWRAGAALAATRTGDPRGAALIAHRFLDEARADARAHLEALALRTLAAVDSAVAPADRIANLRAARALLTPGTAVRLAATVATDLAGLLLMRPPGPDHDEARALLREAEDLATREQLWPLQSRVRRHLERLGEVPRRVDREAADLLTASETRVCRLAISGMSNKAVAAELGVSVKAVEWHLGHVYRKLAISSRAELVRVLGSTI